MFKISLQALLKGQPHKSTGGKVLRKQLRGDRTSGIFQSGTDLAKLLLQIEADGTRSPTVQNPIPELLLQLKFREARDIDLKSPAFLFSARFVLCY